MGFLSTQATTTNIQTVNPGILVPSGVIFQFAGSVAPSGYLICDGTAYSRTTYSNLFSAISTIYGIGDGVNTFNIPDLRYSFIRGRSANISQIGTGTLSTTVNFDISTDAATLANHGLTNGSVIQFKTITTTTGISINTDYYIVNATTNTFQLSLSLGGSVIDLTGANGTGVFKDFGVFTNHGIKRTGMRVRITGTAPTGLALSTSYYAVVINDNNIGFASSYANATAATPTLITVSGSIAATTVIQWEDPDIATRGAAYAGGSTGSVLGSRQEDQFTSHSHSVTMFDGAGTGAPASSGGAGGTSTLTVGAVGGTQTNPRNVYVNYIIKV